MEIKVKDFSAIAIRGMVDNLEDGFRVSRINPVDSIITQFTDCDDPGLLTVDQKLDLLVSIFESTYGVR